MRNTKHKVLTSSDSASIEALALAQLGQSDDVIMEATGLTKCQIAYRLTKGKKLEGYAKGTGYRTAWRSGKSEAAQTVVRMLIPSLKRDIKQNVPKLLVHPTTEISPKK